MIVVHSTGDCMFGREAFKWFRVPVVSLLTAQAVRRVALDM